MAAITKPQNREDFINLVAKRLAESDITVPKATIRAILAAGEAELVERMADGYSFSFVGFGSLKPMVRPEKETLAFGKKVVIPEKTVAVFKPSKVLNDKLTHAAKHR